MAAPTKPANVKKALANSGPSTHGTSRHSPCCNIFGRYWGHSGRWSARGLNRSVAIDPKRQFATLNCRIAKGSLDHPIGDCGCSASSIAARTVPRYGKDFLVHRDPMHNQRWSTRYG
jgi:hypothetical protein